LTPPPTTMTSYSCLGPVMCGAFPCLPGSVRPRRRPRVWPSRRSPRRGRAPGGPTRPLRVRSAAWSACGRRGGDGHGGRFPPISRPAPRADGDH